jgi:hypothetical protein
MDTRKRNIIPISILHPMVRYITYNDTLIVLENNLIGQYFVSNLTLFRKWSVSSIPLAAFINSTNIFISFYNNASINRYDIHNELYLIYKNTNRTYD